MRVSLSCAAHPQLTLRTKDTPVRAGCICLQETERLFGRKPIVYAPDSFINDIFDERISEGYDLWVARYSDEKPLCGNWIYWQFTDKAVIYGVEGKADLSVIR